MSFNVSEALEWVLQYRNIWNEVESQLFEKLAREPIKGEGKYFHCKLKTWKEHIKMNFHGLDVPYVFIARSRCSIRLYCNVTAVLRTDSV